MKKPMMVKRIQLRDIYVMLVLLVDLREVFFETHPEYDLHIVAVPTIAQVVRKEAPRITIVLFREDDPDTSTLRSVSNIEPVVTVVSPDDAQK